MSARSNMTMRATVERNTTTSTNSWGTPDSPTFTEQADQVPCRAWSKTRRDVTDDGKSAVVEDMRAMVPNDADIQEGDQLTITDRNGTTVFGGPVVVDAKVRRNGPPGSGAMHQELMLRRHT